MGTRASALPPPIASASRCLRPDRKSSKSPGETRATRDDHGRGRAHLGDASGVLRGTGPPPTRVVKWRIGPTFPWAMLWRKKDPPELAMRCRFANCLLDLARHEFPGPSLSSHGSTDRRPASTADPDGLPVSGPLFVDDSLRLFSQPNVKPSHGAPPCVPARSTSISWKARSKSPARCSTRARTRCASGERTAISRGDPKPRWLSCDRPGRRGSLPDSETPGMQEIPDPRLAGTVPSPRPGGQPSATHRPPARAGPRPDDGIQSD